MMKVLIFEYERLNQQQIELNNINSIQNAWYKQGSIFRPVKPEKAVVCL